MAIRLELEFDNAADALVFIRLAEMATGVRIIDQQANNSLANANQSLPTATPSKSTAIEQSEQMKELDDMLPDWFKA